MPSGHQVARRPADLTGDSVKPLTRMIADQLFSRTAGAEQVHGNALRLLRDGAENYPAWLDAISGAKRFVHFENYIIENDAVGRQFAAALTAKARQGVPVRVLYDWLGCLTTWPGFWRALRQAGIEVRCFNRPRLDSPFGWLSRNHRKSVNVDGTVGFVAGLCVAEAWAGNEARGKISWRDTGVEVRGPAVADLDAAFAQSWAYAGAPLPAEDAGSQPEDAGAISVRVVGSKPNTMGIYRLDQMIAGIARESLWLTDAYYAGTTAYTRALCDAANDGVDVRLLVPGASDLVIAKAISRAGYRPLLEAGVKVYEWNGPMLHAKTAVADGRWARIGSSNLNIASWMGNWELDVAVEDAGFAKLMQEMYLQDLDNATEIVLQEKKVKATAPKPPRAGGRGSPGRLSMGAVGVGSTVTAAITNRRPLGPAEATVMAGGGLLLLVVAVLAVVLPRFVTVPIAVLAAWMATTLLVRAGRLGLGRKAPADGR